MRVTCLKNIRLADGRLVRRGVTLELSPALAKLYLELKAVEPAILADMRENPSPPAGEPLSASQAGQVSPQTTVKPLDDGDLEVKPQPVEVAEKKRRGRPKKRSS